MSFPLHSPAASIRRLTRTQKDVHRVRLDILYAVYYPIITGDLHNIDIPSRQCRGCISGELPGELFR
jgi:hypothetical protein